jgi:coniferyl-aldehyde dehydrogenase
MLNKPLSGLKVLDLTHEYFSEDEVAVVTGGVDISQKFSELPFDHLLFTGSTHVGR